MTDTKIDDQNPQPSWRDRLGFRMAERAVRKRPTRTWEANASARRVLVIMPNHPEHEVDAWRFIRKLDLPIANLTLLGEPGAILSPPSKFGDVVVRLEASDFNMLGLLRRQAVGKAWASPPDVTLCMRRDLAPWAAHVAGAAPGAFRIGWYSDEAAPYFDIMVKSGSHYGEGIDLLAETLPNISPIVLPLR
ncbi:hypothetical protein BH23BAC4_BH23BAC4_14040 [soil metagenome]